MYPQTFAPSPQPIIFVNNATIVITAANAMIAGPIFGSSTLRPILAKKIGLKSKYDNTSNFDAMN